MEKFIHEFGINWQSMVAQLVNFTVLVLVLGKFVYKPIIKALDARRKKIEDGVAFSDKAEKELASVEVMKADEMKKAELKGQEIIKKAEGDAQRVGGEITAGAEKEKERILNTGKTILLEQKATMEKNFYQGAAGVVKEALSKVLAKGDFAKEEEMLIAETLKEVKVK